MVFKALNFLPVLLILLPFSIFSQQGVAPGTGAAAGIGPWGLKAPLLEANSEMAVAELNGKIYVMGGYPSSRQTVATVQVYDPATDSWRLGTPLPVPINHPMAAGVNGILYMIGGQRSASGSPSRAGFLDTVFALDPAKGAWEKRTPMPRARGGGVPAAIGTRIYVAGGRPPRGHDFAVYDTVTDRWRVLADLPTQRNHMAAAAIDGRIYVAGGRFGPGFRSELTNVLEMYDPTTNTWTRKALMPTIRSGVNGIAINGCFHVFGGEGNKDHPRGLFPQYEVYNPRHDRWLEFPPMPNPVHGVTGAVFFNGWLHLPGGGISIGGSSGSTMHQVVRATLSCR